MPSLPRIALTPGEPAGIGPDLVLALDQLAFNAELIVVADPELMRSRARELGLPVKITTFHPGTATRAADAGSLKVLPIKAAASAHAGLLDPANAGYVLETLRCAADGCLRGAFDAMVTGPVQKSVINEAGIPFTGHTEFLAERVGGCPVMMLVAGELRLALATTHLPLAKVSKAITRERLTRIIPILHNDLRVRFGIDNPRLLVCGLNPHAGEAGYLGCEEIEVITPALDALRNQGLDLIGPLPADTVFTPKQLSDANAVLAMYHDQGLPVLKHVGFGRAVNVTLGLPIIRTSVDHGTALNLAGTGRANAGSLAAAVALAIAACNTPYATDLSPSQAAGTTGST